MNDSETEPDPEHQGRTTGDPTLPKRSLLVRLPGLFLIGMVRIYQRTISPLLGPNCRYTPTCSSYFIEAIEKYGVIRGVVKGVWRICRCNPLGGSGHDPP